MAHQAGAYPRSLRVFILPHGWDASPSQGYPSIKLAATRLDTCVERAAVRVKCPAQEHNTMSQARAAGSEDEHTNHEATAPL